MPIVLNGLYLSMITFTKKQLKIADVNVRIMTVLWSRYPLYKLQIMEHNKVIYDQIETGAWIRDDFLDIYEKLKAIKGENNYLKSIKRIRVNE